MIPGTCSRLLRAIDDYRRGLARPAAETERLQLARLSELVTFAWERVPYYRQLFDSAGFHPRQLRTLSELRAIPITTRERLQSVPPADLLAAGTSAGELLPIRSSGSTGTPVTVWRSPLEKRMGLLVRLRTWRHHGLLPTDRVLTINGRPSRLPRSQARSLPGRWNLSLFEEPELMLSAFERIRPTVIYGYSYHVARLAKLAGDRGTKAPSPRMVATSGDALLPVFREMIRSAWGVDPIDIYNASELGDIAWQCGRRDGLHLNSDQVVLELLRDGRPAGAGQPGEVVATHLQRYSMPLIRYSPGDLAVPGDQPCPCGVELPLIGALSGRTLDVAPLPDGTWYIGFIRLLSNVREITRYQVTQPALDHFQISVVPGPGFTQSSIETIRGDVESQFSQPIRIEVLVVDEGTLIRTPVKLRAVIPYSRVDFGNAPWH